MRMILAVGRKRSAEGLPHPWYAQLLATLHRPYGLVIIQFHVKIAARRGVTWQHETRRAATAMDINLSAWHIQTNHCLYFSPFLRSNREAGAETSFGLYARFPSLGTGGALVDYASARLLFMCHQHSPSDGSTRHLTV